MAGRFSVSGRILIFPARTATVTDVADTHPDALREKRLYSMTDQEALKIWPPYKRMQGWIDSFRITHPNGLTLDEMHKAVAGYINTHYIHVDDHEAAIKKLRNP